MFECGLLFESQAGRHVDLWVVPKITLVEWSARSFQVDVCVVETLLEDHLTGLVRAQLLEALGYLRIQIDVRVDGLAGYSWSPSPDVSSEPGLREWRTSSV